MKTVVYAYSSINLQELKKIMINDTSNYTTKTLAACRMEAYSVNKGNKFEQFIR